MHRKGVCLRSHVLPRDSEHLKVKKSFTNVGDYCYYSAHCYDGVCKCQHLLRVLQHNVLEVKSSKNVIQAGLLILLQSKD